MTRYDDKISLQYMLDHAEETLSISQGRSRNDLDKDRLLALGLIKLVENIGEAAVRVSTSIKEAYPEIPWKQIVGTRNRLIHGYDEVDYDVLWRIVSVELSPLAQQIKQILISIV
jgi:uncharacterized protein with HEPN domain